MPAVTIHYCVPCRYQAKAIEDADAILKEFGEALTDVRLVPGAHGVYDVAIDGDVVFSLERAMRFPVASELIDAIRERVRPKPAGPKKA